MNDKDIKKLEEERDNLQKILEESIKKALSNTLNRLLLEFKNAKDRLNNFEKFSGRNIIIDITDSSNDRDELLKLHYDGQSLSLRNRSNQYLGIFASHSDEIRTDSVIRSLDLFANLLKDDALFNLAVEELNSYVETSLKQVQESLDAEIKEYTKMIDGLKGIVMETSIG